MGDEGECMYIIYKGEVEVIINDKYITSFYIRNLVGRTALETQSKR
jgi:hypothetical protein